MKTYNPTEHSSSHKMILSGNSGAGKTGALLTLATVGYNIKIADFDDKAGGLLGKNGVIPLEIAKAKVSIAPFRETTESQANAYKSFKAFLDGPDSPFTWGPEDIFAIDSLTKLGKAVFDFTKRANPSIKDGRQIYGLAQEELDNLLTRLTSSQLKCHLVLICHIEYQDLYGGTEGMPVETQGYPAGIGKAKNKLIPTVFNTMLEVTNKKEKRFIRTTPSRFMLNKIPVLPSAGLKEEYPLETGMIEIFKLLDSNA